MAFYMIQRVKAKDAWRNLSKEEKEKWRSGHREARQDAGINRLVEYPSYLSQNMTVVSEIASVDAWDDYIRRVRDAAGLDVDRYFEYESDLCFKREQMHG